MSQELFKGDHQDLVILLNNTSLAYSKLNDPINSLKYAKQALEMAFRLFTTPHPMLVVCYYCLGKSYGQIENLNLEHEHILEALQMSYILKHLFNINLSFDLSMLKVKFDDFDFKFKVCFLFIFIYFFFFIFNF